MMSLEATIEANTVAIAAMTAAILGKGGAAKGVTSPPAAAKPPKAAKRTAEEVMAIAVRVKNDISKEAASFLISKHGGANLKALKPAVFEAFYADCESALEAGEVEGMTDPEDDI